MILNIVLWIIFGALAGWIASMIMKTNASMGAMANIVVGILGAFIGGFLVQTLTGTAVEGFNISSFVVAILGAVILLAIVKAVRGGTPHHAYFRHLPTLFKISPLSRAGSPPALV